MTGWKNIIHRIQTQHWNPYWLQSTIWTGISVIVINCPVAKHDRSESLIKFSYGFSLKNRNQLYMFLESKEEIKVLHKVSLLPSWHDPCQFVLQTYAGAWKKKNFFRNKKINVIPILNTPNNK